MGTVRNILKLAVGAGLAALLMTACSKPAEPPSLPPIAPVQKKAEQPKEHPKQATVITTVVPAPVAPVPLPPAAPPVVDEESVPAVETAYVSNPDFSERVQNIYKLSDLGTPEAIGALGRLFRQEKDNELKTEILDSLFDIDGQDERKSALLAAGAMAAETKEVRQSAIDGLGNIDAKVAIPILQALISDPDEDIRESAKDTIDQLQTQSALQK